MAFRTACIPVVLFPVLLLSAMPIGLEPDAVASKPRNQDVRYKSGELELAAELILPEVEGRAPGAVIIQGSGDSDRSNGWAAAIAGVLADAGVAVLLTDKRGCGASGGSWLTADFQDLADDALAGVAYLRGRPEVDPERVGVVGLSQGGWVAPIAAARSPDVAFVIDISGASVGFAEQVTVEMANTSRQAGLSDDGVQTVLELNSAAGRYGLTGEWEPYAALREAGLQTEARPVVAGFPATPEDPKWSFIRGVGAYDPMPYWTVVRQPVLVVYGQEDEGDNVPVAESVRRLEHAFDITRKKNAEIVVIPGAGHGFIETGRSRLMSEFVETLAGWVTKTLLR